MSTTPMFRLYELLASVYRIDDDRNSHALEQFLELIQTQADLLKKNIDELYDDFFIETCAEWVIPYIGDLVGNIPLHEVLSTRRADVARTLYYRRRKGTLPVLEELARDITGWSVHAVPFFETLVWTQNMNHVRPDSGTVDIRSIEHMSRIGGAFDPAARTLDIRLLDQRRGWHHPKHVGFFFWRLMPYVHELSVAFREDLPNAHGFYFDPVGVSAPLFQRPSDPVQGQISTEAGVAQPIRREAFFEDASTFYDPAVTPVIVADGNVVPPESLVFTDLSAWAPPAAGQVAMDAWRGRLSFAAGEEPAAVQTSYSGSDLVVAAQEAAPNDHGWHFALLGVRIDILSGPPQTISPDRMRYMHLDAWDQPPAGTAGVDLGLGRITFPAGEVPAAAVTVQFGDAPEQEAVRALPPNDHGFAFMPPVNMASIRIARDGAPVPLPMLFCQNLEAWERPPAGRVGIDVRRGRISYAAGDEPAGGTVVSYVSGFSGDLGGGTYDRTAPARPGTLNESEAAASLNEPAGQLIRVGAAGLNTIAEALTEWRNSGRIETTIQIDDSRTYEEDLLLDDFAASQLVIQAANRQRPVIVGDVTQTEGDGNGMVLLSGLTILGAVRAEGNLGRLIISHCTVVPDPAPVLVATQDNASIAIAIERSICGGVSLPPESAFDAEDCIFQFDGLAVEGQTVASFRAVTIFGGVDVREIALGSNSIFTEPIVAARRQSGCVRYSWLPVASVTPRRYLCQPETAIEEAPTPAAKVLVESRLRPSFTSNRYGHPGYGQLSLDCPAEIRTGGEDGREMGAFQFLEQPRREINLRLRLDEYLPFGLSAGPIYMS